MKNPLPPNEDLEAFSSAIPWKTIDKQQRKFREKLQELQESGNYQDGILPLEDLSNAVGAPITLHESDSSKGNVLQVEVNNKSYILGTFVSERYRKNKSLIESIIPYNFNPSVNHSNIHETDTPHTRMRALGAELELGLYHEEGEAPTEEEIQQFIYIYKSNARKLGITPQVDREACQYQVEVHVSPGIGYNRTRQALDSIMGSLVVASNATQLNTAILSAYPIHSDFTLTPDPKVQTAVDVMTAVNQQFPEYMQRQADVKARYFMDEDANVVQTFRLQGCHIHLDLAGRSEALGLFTFYTMLRSATAIANTAVLKGGPFVNGTCDPELLCTREYLRSATVTGRYLEMPISPHLQENGLENFLSLLISERANAVVRGLLYEDGLGIPVSVMHNPIGRLRPDLGTSKRICTLESTGLPVNISAARQAAILTDFEFTHALVENYFRQHGCNLEPLYDDPDLMMIIGALDQEVIQELQDTSDRVGTNMILKTALGTELSLPEFYEKKRIYMHTHLIDILDTITPRDIDDVYTSLNRMLAPPSGRQAQTIEQYLYSPSLRSTGNWGAILRDAFLEEGGVLGKHEPEIVLKVANRVHNALRKRYE